MATKIQPSSGIIQKAFFDLKFDDSETIIFFVEMPHAIQA